MIAAGEHPLKPRSAWCRLKPLLAWTGWNEKQVRAMAASGLLHPQQLPKMTGSGRGTLGRRYFVVAEVAEILKGQ